MQPLGLYTTGLAEQQLRIVEIEQEHLHDQAFCIAPTRFQVCAGKGGRTGSYMWACTGC